MSAAQSTAPFAAVFASVAAVAAAASLAGSARAGVTNAYYGSDTAYNYRITHMTDLDQVRGGLPSQGAMFCVPTAAVNLFAYAANHGYPFVLPGMGDWEADAMFTTGTAYVATMGVIMNTNGATGTTGTGLTFGMVAWGLGTGLLTTDIHLKTASYTPSNYKLAKLACQGWVLSLTYGRYQSVATLNGYPVFTRSGGHAVTLTRAYRNGSTRILRYRDPASETYYYNDQSPFEDKEVVPTALTAYFGDGLLRSMTALDYPSADGLARVLDGYYGIRPMFGLKFSNISMTEGGGSITLMDPTPLEGSVNLTLPQIPVSSTLAVDDLVLHPEMTEALVIARSTTPALPAELRMLDLFTGAMTTLPGAPLGLVRMAVSREDSIYAFDIAGKLYKLNVDGTVAAAISSNPTPVALGFDDAHDQLWLLSVASHRVVKYAKTLNSHTNQAVPAEIPMSGDGSIAVDPTTGAAWWVTRGSPLIFNVTTDVSGLTVTKSITPPTMPGGPNSIQFGDRGELYLIGDGSVKVMKKTGADTWAEDVLSPFNNLPGGTRMVLSHNVSNVDPAVHDTPEWNDILPADLLPLGVNVADCDADLNGDNLVDGADLGILLGTWGPSRAAADINGDGQVDGADLGALLGAWGACP